MDRPLTGISPKTVTNRSSFEIENPNETTPLTGAKATNPTSTGFWSCFSGLSVGASTLGRGFATCCESVTRPIMSAYRFVVDKLFPPPKENKISYAWRSVTINDSSSNSKHDVPKSGSFRAGAEFRSKLGSEIAANTVKLLKMGDESLSQFQRDMKGSTSYILKDGADEQRINYHDEQRSEQESAQQFATTIKSLNEFTGGQNLYFTQAVATVATQKLGTKSGDVLSAAQDNSSNIIAIPAGSTATARLEYSIEKENEDSFIVHYHESDEGSEAGKAPALLVKNQAGQSDYITPDSSSVEKKLSLHVTRNKSFDSAAPIMAENLPCHIECLDFTTSYKVGG